MADFKTHFIGGAFVAGVGAVALRASDVAQVEEAAGYFAVGVVGGLLPDLDLGSSVPVQIARRLSAIVATLLVVLAFADSLSMLELALIGVGSYTLAQVSFEMLDRFTVHRGLIHSLPATAIAGLATGALATYGFDATPLMSWFYASFMSLGFFTHLVLDEIYSVNLLGTRFKRSFGTAITLGDRKNLAGTFVAYFLAFALWVVQPSSTTFWAAVTTESTYTTILQNLTP